MTKPRGDDHLHKDKENKLLQKPSLQRRPGPRLRLTYGEEGDVEQGSSDRVGNEEYDGSDRVGNEKNYGTNRVVNKDNVSSDCEEGSGDESWYAENIKISDGDDDILDYCEDEDFEVNEGGNVGQQNR
ncbi:hypothetical protein F0562_011800 [Nyssa sinensis]|uniref:Uncharacterized protein n=1 Tax=Nyssa sinensis TaxID=561372 RepID=A0A5J4ZV96_9ASTE|nr:hypothetical protein F0562_011800 [Nyssa sinensis]